MEDSLSLSSDDTESESGARSPCSPDAGITFPLLGSCYAVSPCSSLLGKQDSFSFWFNAVYISLLNFRNINEGILIVLSFREL